MKRTTLILSLSLYPVLASQVNAAQAWEISTDAQWAMNASKSENLEFKGDLAAPQNEKASFTSVIKKFAEKKTIQPIIVEQSSSWLNWTKIPNVGPKNAEDAPVFLSVKEKD